MAGRIRLAGRNLPTPASFMLLWCKSAMNIQTFLVDLHDDVVALALGTGRAVYGVVHILQVEPDVVLGQSRRRQEEDLAVAMQVSVLEI